MTLWDILNNSLTSLFSIFSTKTDYCSYLMSDSTFVLFTTLYYKIQYIFDSTYILMATIYTFSFASISSVTLDALTIALKFLVLIALLIFIRGGIPRYRFDHLTKIGWIKYLSLVLASMLIQFLLLWMC